MKQTRREIRFCVQTEVPYKNTAIGKDMWLGGRSTRFISESGPLVPSLVIPAAPSPSPRRAETGSSGQPCPGAGLAPREGPGPPPGRSADVRPVTQLSLSKALSCAGGQCPAGLGNSASRETGLALSGGCPSSRALGAGAPLAPSFTCLEAGIATWSVESHL